MTDDLYADLRGRTSYRGPVGQRPPAHTVPVGFLYEASDAPYRWKSDGHTWLDAGAEVEPWRLEYAEDLANGQMIRQERPLPSYATGTLGQLLGANPRITEWIIVDDHREYGELISIRGVRPDGEQIPIYCMRGEQVRVRSELSP